MRNIRRQSNQRIKKLLKKKEISENEEKKYISDVQIITNKHIINVDNLIKNKISIL